MWDEGYVSEVDYVHGYFAEMAPARLRLALLSRGIHAPIRENPAYLELGFGQGLSLAIHAMTSAGTFYGTDFNPAQAANARDLIAAGDRPVAIFEDAFEQFAARTDLPQFDIIALHGIWSWVSPEARAAIIRIASRQLVAGGILYVSYNAMPGWAPSLALRQLLAQYSQRVARGGLLAQVEQSIAFVDELIDTDIGYFAANPGVAQRLRHIKGQDPHYVSHEYFNRNWTPMSFLEVSDHLFEAKLSFAASANLIDNIAHLAWPASAVDLRGKLTDPAFLEQTRDYLVNQQFRRDIFVKGIRPIGPTEHLELVREQRFLLTGDPENPPRKIVGGAGEAGLRPDIYDPILARIAELDDQPFGVPDFLSSTDDRDATGRIWEALVILTATGFVAPVEPAHGEPSIAASRRLNRELCRRARYSDQIQFLAAPRIGCGVPVSRIEQLFLQANAGDPVDAAQEILARQGHHLIVAGEVVTDAEQTRTALIDLYTEFVRRKRPLLQRLGAI